MRSCAHTLTHTPQDVNALKVCGLNQGHFMNASDYMSVCQSTRKVNNPFVVGWQRAAVAVATAAAAVAWLELVWLSVVDVSLWLWMYRCCFDTFTLMLFALCIADIVYMRCTVLSYCVLLCILYDAYATAFFALHMYVACTIHFLFFFLVSYVSHFWLDIWLI